MGKFRQIFTELSARDTIVAGYYSLTFLFNLFIAALICINKFFVHTISRGLHLYFIRLIGKYVLITHIV